MMEIILILFIILVFARAFRWIFARMQQPSVIGEIFAGILIGPSILNLISPTAKGLDILADLGIFFLIFFAGMEMHMASMKEYYRAIIIALMSIFFSILAGMAIGRLFNLDLISSLFVSIVFALTALPISVRILMDMGKMNSPVGNIIVTSAVIDDVFSFVFLAIVLSIAEGASKIPDAAYVLMTITKVAVFLLIIYILNRLLTAKNGFLPRGIKLLFSKLDKESQFFAVIIFGIFAGYIGELLEITFIIGVFYAGILVKKTTIGIEGYEHSYDVISSITLGIFAPIFFVYMGILLDISMIFDYSDIFSARNLNQAIFLLAAILFATAGKSGGAFLGGLLAKLKTAEALAVGFALNARGMVGLVIAGIGLRDGLINMSIYAMLVMLCIVTTIIAPIGLKRFLNPPHD
jgi:Kef-type K+ transport system membrane component KefB